MKKLLSSFAIMTTMTAPTVVQAQSAVTVYGVLDVGLNISSNQGGDSTRQLSSVGVQGSRLGFRGVEDLGRGLKALFVLENGFDPMNGNAGQGGRLFGRQAFVGLESDTWGKVTLGRQYDPLVDNLAPLTSNGGWAGIFFSHPFDNDNTDNTIRFNNALKYTTRSFGPISASGMYAFSNQAGDFKNNRGWGFGTKYVGTNLKLGAAYLAIDNGGISTANPNPTGAAPEAPFTAGKQRTYGLGANYLMDDALTLGATWTRSALKDVGATLASGINTRFDNYELNGRYKISSPLVLGVAYTHTTASTTGRPGVSHSKWDQISFIADYSLSKRTNLYSEFIYQKAGGDPFVATASGGPAAMIRGLTASSSDSQSLIRFGMRHSF